MKNRNYWDLTRKVCGIYLITNVVNGKQYVGQSQDIGRRWRDHLGSKLTDHFHSALRKYGIKNFIFEILEECPKEKLNERECYWINYLNTFVEGYNSTTGGGQGTEVSAATRKKISEANKGENHPMYGRPCSEYSKQRVSEANKGNQHHLGHKQSDYCKQRVSAAHKGRPCSDYCKQRISSALKGRPTSDYQKQRSRETHSIPVLDTRTGITYPSGTAWAEANGYTKQNANYYIKKGILLKLDKPTIEPDAQ